MSNRRQLPAPRQQQGLAGALMARRSVREYAAGALPLSELGRLLWAGQGLSHSSGRRTAPSPHALYPLTLYLVTGDVTDVEAGLYVYEPRAHALDAVGHGDLRGKLYHASLDEQPWVRDCAAVIVVAGDMQNVEDEFRDQPPDGRRGRRYVYIEAGAVAQNIALEATELAIGTVLVGGFHDDRVKQHLGIDLDPLVMMPLGRQVE